MGTSKSIFKTVITGLVAEAKKVEAGVKADFTKLKAFIGVATTDAQTVADWAEQILAGKTPSTTNETLQDVFKVLVVLVKYIPNATIAIIVADINEGLTYINDLSDVATAL